MRVKRGRIKNIKFSVGGACTDYYDVLKGTTRVHYIGQADNPTQREQENLDKTTYDPFYPVTLKDGVNKKMARFIEFFGMALYGELSAAIVVRRIHSLLFQTCKDSTAERSASKTSKPNGRASHATFVREIRRRRWPSSSAVCTSSAHSSPTPSSPSPLPASQSQRARSPTAIQRPGQ